MAFEQHHQPLAPLCITVDLEDWQQSVYCASLPVSNRFLIGAERLLALFQQHGVVATWFVLGNVAAKAAGLLKTLQQLGHDIQSHGMSHCYVHQQTPAIFADDLRRAKSAVEDITGNAVIGYRAPRFSIGPANTWALEMLAAEGFQFDSSIFPMRIRGYGWSRSPRVPYIIRTGAGTALMELPVLSTTTMSMRSPAGGGGYLRLLPSWWMTSTIQRERRQGTPAVLYMHPHEVDPDGLRQPGLHVPWRTRIHQGVGRRGFLAKLDAILSQGGPFITMRELATSWQKQAATVDIASIRSGSAASTQPIEPSPVYATQART